MPPPHSDISWFHLTIGLLGGLALFLYGMERMAEALKAVAGTKLRAVLGALAKNRFVGLATGTFVTAIIQSSSVTTVMLVGFVSAGLMTLTQSVGVILGADIGTTITAQIIAFKVTKYALLFVSVGFGMLFLSKRKTLHHYGYIVMGLGLIFFGMGVMSDAMTPLRDYEPFLALMRDMANPLQGILAAALFTALVQSSSATMGLIIVFAMQGVISLEGGIALALGANIGTCATAALAALGKPREAVRVAAVHIGFKVVGVALFAPFIPQFAEWVVQLSPTGDPSLEGRALLADVVPRQIANAHTLFNVTLGVAFLPFTKQIAALVTRLLPDRPAKPVVKVRFLDRVLLKTPPLAIEVARKELHRLGTKVYDMVVAAEEPVLSGTSAELDEVWTRDKEINALYGEVVMFLSDASRESLTKNQAKEVLDLLSVANDIESIGDVTKELLRLGHKRVERGVTVSDQTMRILRGLFATSAEALEVSVKAIKHHSASLAAEVVAKKPVVSQLVHRAEQHQAGRLLVGDPLRLESYTTEIDMIDRLRRIYYHAKRVAKVLAATAKVPAPPSETLSEQISRLTGEFEPIDPNEEG